MGDQKLGFMKKFLLSLFFLVTGILLIGIMATMIGGVFGIAWAYIAKTLGYEGLTAEEAFQMLGSPEAFLEWLSSVWRWIYENILLPIWNAIQNAFKGG